MSIVRKTFFPVLSLLLSIVGLVVLISFSLQVGASVYVVSSALFGSALIIIYAVFTALHLLRGTKYESVMRKIHNASSYILISATYTPIYLAVFPSGWGWSMFGITWGLTALGIFLYCFKGVSSKVHTVIYILIDWIIVVAFVPLYASLPFFAIKILTLGSALYTMSVIMDKRGHIYFSQINMLLGSIVHIWFMVAYVLS